MIEVLSTNILSPLGETTAANLAAVLRGELGIALRFPVRAVQR